MSRDRATTRQSTLFAEDSHVRTSPAPASERASAAPSLASGTTSRPSSRRSARASSSSKTSRAACGLGCPRCGGSFASWATEFVPSCFLPPMSEPPHLRRRVFVVAYSDGFSPGGAEGSAGSEGVPDAGHPDRDGESAQPEHGEVAGLRGMASGAPAWTSPPVFRGVDDGVPGRVDRARRLRALGNAVVPQQAEAIGRMILEMMA